jgi:hypothetical protein
MKLFDLFSASAVAFLFAVSTNAQALPAKITNYLNQNYKGWTKSPANRFCSEAGKYVFTGDFNDDRRTDYIVKLARGNRGYVIAFLTRGAEYRPRVLENVSAREIKDMGVVVYKKGSPYSENETAAPVKLKADAPYIGTCGSDDGALMRLN